MDSFLGGVSQFFKIASESNSTDEAECKSDVDHYKFYQYCLIPSIVITLLMAATKPRRRKLLSVLYGRPGLIYPMNTLTRSSRISYCCAFGATGFLVYQILLDGQFAVNYSGPLALKTLIAVVSMFIYGMVFFPLFTSLALGTAASFGVGSLYVWMLFIVEIYKVNECNITAIGRAVLLTRALPILLCLAYLSIAMPVKFCIAIYHNKYFTANLGEDPYDETVEEIKASYQGKHVTNLLGRPKVVIAPKGIGNIIKDRAKGKVGAWIYHNQSGFRYPSRLLSVMFVGACVVYVIAVQLLAEFVPLFNEMIEEYEEIFVRLGYAQTDGDDVEIERTTTNAIYYMVQILKVSLIVSVTISCVITLLNILHMMSSFRTNLFALYKGDFSHIPPPHLKSAISLCTGSIKYAGFQVAYIVWAFVISCGILFLVCLVLATIIEILLFGYTDWLVNKLLQFWPGFIIAICLFWLQFLLAKFVFLQDRGQHLRLDNRRFYFVFVYFMFFYNIFLGLVSCLMRIIKAMIVGTIFLARLDNSALPRKFEFLDPGFNAYQGYIHMEAAHTHPVVNVFLRLLFTLSNSRKKEKSGDILIEMSHFEVAVDIDSCKLESSTDHPTTRPVNIAARFNWHVAYTLLQNPMVRIYRKGFIQCMKKARKEGLKIPISDSPITDFDIVKAQEDRDKQRAEERKKADSPSHSLSDGLSGFGSMMGGVRKDGVKTRQNRKRPRMYNWFRKWKKRNETLVSLDGVPEERALENDYRETYTKTENV